MNITIPLDGAKGIAFKNLNLQVCIYMDKIKYMERDTSTDSTNSVPYERLANSIMAIK